MSQTGQVAGGVEFKAPASKVHEFFALKLPDMSSVCPEKVQGIDLLEGEWGKPGSIILWRYANAGKPGLTAKELIEEIDYNNHKITFKIVDGTLFDPHYKNFRFFFHATPKGEASSVVTWTLKYDKPHEKVPEPTAILDFCLNVTKDVAAHLA